MQLYENHVILHKVCQRFIVSLSHLLVGITYQKKFFLSVYFISAKKKIL